MDRVEEQPHSPRRTGWSSRPDGRDRVRHIAFLILVAPILALPPGRAGEPRFETPFILPDVLAVAIDAGDFNGDGKLDLAAASGTGLLLVLLQDRVDRLDWIRVSVSVGNGCYFLRAADFDGDGYDDLAVADPASTAYFVRSNGDGTFEPPAALEKTKTSRWLTTGDWNADGMLDLASANHDLSTVSVLTGDGAGNFTVTQEDSGDDTHAIEALDYDGNGILDLALGVGTAGLRLSRGLGNARFERRGGTSNLGCVRFLAAGDFDRDGKGDLALICDQSRVMTIGISRGTGAYRDTFRALLSGGEETPAVADLNGDGNEDVAVTTSGKPGLAVHLGTGAGTFLSPPLLFGPIGKAPSFFIAGDLDQDGRNDVVSADTGSSSLTILWGRDGARFLESAAVVDGFGSAKGLALADFDKDGKLDFFLPNQVTREVFVYLNPGGTSVSKPSLTIRTAHSYRSLEVLDLDEDGVLDLAGTSLPDLAVLALLGADGSVHGEIALPAGQSPAAIRAGRLDEGDAWDLAVLSGGSNHVAVFLGLGGGRFADVRTVATVEAPKGMALGDLDGDGRTDWIVVSRGAVVAHFGRGAGAFSGPVALASDAAGSFADAAFGELGGDGIPEVVILRSGTMGVVVLQGKGAGLFEEPVALEAGTTSANSLFLHDVDGDSLLDITVSSGAAESVSILLNRGSGIFSSPVVYRVGAVDLGHRFADLDSDGVLDMSAFSSTAVTTFFGREEVPPAASPFRRGDTDGGGKVAINDCVAVLNWLFRGGDPPSCVDAADGDDDGVVGLTDPIRVLRWLFLGADPLPPPGPESCGDDPTPDDLARCAGACQQ